MQETTPPVVPRSGISEGILSPACSDVVPHNDTNNALGQRVPKLLQNLAKCCNLFLLCACEDHWVSSISPLALAFQVVIECAGKDAKLECCSMCLHLPWSNCLQGCLQLLIWPLVPTARPVVIMRRVANQTLHPITLSVHGYVSNELPSLLWMCSALWTKVIVISGGHGTLKVCSSQYPVCCVPT